MKFKCRLSTDSFSSENAIAKLRSTFIAETRLTGRQNNRRNRQTDKHKQTNKKEREREIEGHKGKTKRQMKKRRTKSSKFELGRKIIEVYLGIRTLTDMLYKNRRDNRKERYK